MRPEIIVILVVLVLAVLVNYASCVIAGRADDAAERDRNRLKNERRKNQENSEGDKRD